jgi:hypothetical protein
LRVVVKGPNVMGIVTMIAIEAIVNTVATLHVVVLLLENAPHVVETLLPPEEKGDVAGAIVDPLHVVPPEEGATETEAVAPRVVIGEEIVIAMTETTGTTGTT